MLSPTFDACKRSVAVAARMSVMLAPCALRYVIPVSSRWFKLNNFILNGCNVLYCFIICGWFKVNKEEV